MNARKDELRARLASVSERRCACGHFHTNGGTSDCTAWNCPCQVEYAIEPAIVTAVRIYGVGRSPEHFLTGYATRVDTGEVVRVDLEPEERFWADKAIAAGDGFLPVEVASDRIHPYR